MWPAVKDGASLYCRRGAVNATPWPTGNPPFVRQKSQKSPGGTRVAPQFTGASDWAVARLACADRSGSRAPRWLARTKPEYGWKTAEEKNSPLCSVNPKRPIGLKWFSACGFWLEIMRGGFPAPSPSDCLRSLWDEATQTPPAKQTLRHRGASNYIQYVDSVTTLCFLLGTLHSSKKTKQNQKNRPFLSIHPQMKTHPSCFFLPPSLLVHFYPCLIKAS